MKTLDPSLISQADIDAALRHGTGTADGKLRVFAFYQQEHSAKEAAAFLKAEYGDYRHSHIFSDGGRGFIEYGSGKGMVIRRSDTEQEAKITWNAVDKRLRALIDARQYLSAEELASLVTQADIDTLLVRDWSVPGRKGRIYELIQSGLSDEQMEEHLKAEYNRHGYSQEELQTGGMCTLADGAQGYAYYVAAGVRIENRQNGGWREVSYTELSRHIRALTDAGQYLTPEERAALEEPPAPEAPAAPPDPQTAIDDALREWNGDPASVRRVAAHMEAHARDKDTAAFLRAEYGDELPAFPITGAGVTMDMPWPKVQRRIAQLIQQGAFLPVEEQEAPALERPLGPSPSVREIFEHYVPIVKDLVLSDVLYQNACKNSDRQNAYLEGAEAIKRAVSIIEDTNFIRLYYDLTGFHNNLHQRVLDETYPTLAHTPGIAQQERPAPNQGNALTNEDDAAYRLLSRLRADCDYFLGAGQREEKHLWAGSVKAQIAKMRELYAAVAEKPDWLTIQDIERYERQMTALEPQAEPVREAAPVPNVLTVEPTPQAPGQPPYHVGQTVYLDDTVFQITDLRGTEVELLDPSMLYPIFRAESRESFERLLRRDPRNGPITEFLAAELHTLDDDLTDALTNCLLKHNDKAYIAGWFRAGESNTRVAQRLSDTYAQRAETLTLETGDPADLFTSTIGVELEIHDKFNTKRTAAWGDVACMLRALYQWELDGFEQPMDRYIVRETSDAFEEPFIIWDRQVDGYYLVDDVCQTFTDEKEAQAYADRLNSGENALEGVPDYQVGDHVTLPTHDREISGTVGYVGDKEVRIDTGPYAWSNQVVDRETFEEGLRHDEHNADLFTPEDKLPADANFHITDDDLGVGGPKVKYAANVAAIRTLKQIEAEGRNATTAEQETLSRYVGWGGIPDTFDPGKESWAKEYTELKGLLTEAEYESARSSTLNAHYTSPTVIKAIYEAVGNLGYSTGNILEPSCGVGNFFGLLPESMAASKLYGVELDSISGRIAQQLYPKANIAVRGFEKASFPNDFFDLAIGNVPFGQYQVSDPDYNKLGFNIHNYFLAKTLDKLRPGGVAAMLTTRYTLDAKDSAVRQYLAQRADLLGAVRLPNNAFKANAGTDVVTDILFFQKRDSPPVQDPAWVQAVQTPEGFSINRYFQEHPEMVLGTPDSESTQYGHQDYTVAPIPGAVLADQLHEAVSRIHGQITVPELPDLGDDEPIDAAIPADPDVPNFSYTVKDGEVYYRENSIMLKPELTATAAARVKGMVELRDCTRALISDQMENRDDATIAHQQERLNQLYDTFTAKFGLINSKGNALAFADDSAYYLLCSLEVLDDDGNLERKADMFTKRTIQPHRAVTHVDTAAEALAVSIGERAGVDMSYMAQLTGRTEEELAGELRGVIFRRPETAGGEPGYAAADEYLSGNIREKLAAARQATARDPTFSVNVEALEQALPKDLDASEIDVRLGATWVDKQYIQQFMYEIFQTPNYLKGTIGVNFSTFTAEWNISGKTKIPWNNVAAFTTYGTERASAYRILEDSLNLRDVRIYDTVRDPDGSERRVFNAKETTLAQQKQQAVKDAFRDWIWKDPERRRALTRKYNDLYNSIRPREYDGRHITFGGINPEITLREHQLNAIAHVLYGNNVLLAHEVGAGKTFEMAAAAMESKRLGLCQKSLFAVPNHLIEQWASEFLRLYPSANILVARKKDFERANRKKFCAKIATGDYDAIIMGHSQFERLPVSMERRERLLKDQILEITQGIEEMTANGAEKFSIKQLERTKKSLEARLEKLTSDGGKDDVVTFEQLGVDRLFVDEAHSYKNLFLYTKMRNVAGLSTSDAQKSSDMLLKCRYLDEKTGGKGVVFATGTPVFNSMTELYTMQRYLQHDLLQKMGLSHFDNWASTFGETITAIELAPEGTGYRARTRFAKFFNLPELLAMFKEVADIKTADQLNLPVPEVEYCNVVAQPTEAQKELVQELSERAAAVHTGRIDPRVDNMLKITSDGRKLGLDQRLINPMLPDDPNSKLNLCVEDIIQTWREGRADKLTQLVFCDISTPKGRAAANRERAALITGDKTAGGAELHALDNLLDVEPDPPFSVYEDIRDKLIAGGIPTQEIAFIHDANTDARKKELFSKVRSGQVRVLLGSTFKMGAGTNVQDRLITLHDLDCPWRPGDLEQRKGRIVRQGNNNPKVRIRRYVTEGTFDSYLWQTVENKQKFISQIMTSKSPVRSCDDVDATALSYAEIKALCAGNPLIKEKMDLDIDVARLKILKADHESQQFRLEDNLLQYFPEQIKRDESFIAGFKADMETLAAHPHPMIAAAPPLDGTAAPDGVAVPAEPQKGFAGIEVKGDVLTDKDNAGAAILEACKEVKSLDAVEIGHYRGFAMSLTLENFGKDYILTLTGKMTHRVPLGRDARGNLTRMDNALAGMPERLAAVETRLESLHKQVEAAKAELGKPFPQEAELQEKSARLALLNIQLDMDTGKPVQQAEQRPAKQERPSVLEGLKRPLPPREGGKKQKCHQEVL